jgi:hypothetical protein
MVQAVDQKVIGGEMDGVSDGLESNRKSDGGQAMDQEAIEGALDDASGGSWSDGRCKR